MNLEQMCTKNNITIKWPKEKCHDNAYDKKKIVTISVLLAIGMMLIPRITQT